MDISDWVSNSIAVLALVVSGWAVVISRRAQNHVEKRDQEERAFIDWVMAKKREVPPDRDLKSRATIAPTPKEEEHLHRALNEGYFHRDHDPTKVFIHRKP